MAVGSNLGPIPKAAFQVSIGMVFGLAVVAVVVRCFVLRVYIHKKKIQIDDGILFLATGLLISAIVILYQKTIAPGFYLGGFPLYNGQLDEIPDSMVQKSLDFHKWTVAVLMITWLSVCSIKFFFLAFFWKLVDRLPAWKIHWWIVFFFNVVTTIFGVLVFYVSCPHWDIKMFSCPTGGMNGVSRYALAQIILDILGDLMIMAIPLSLIWKTRMGGRQKFGLVIFFSLNSIMIALSIARAAGSNFTGIKYDLWQLYWLTMSANFGLILASGAAFRAFYINHRNSKHSSHSWEGNIKEWPSSQANPSNRSLHGAQHKGQTFFCDSESETTSGSSSKPFARDGSGHVYREKGSEWNNRLDSKHSFSSRDTRDTEDSDVDFGTAQGFFHIQQPRRVIIAPRMPRLG